MNLPFSFLSFAPPVGRDVEAEWFGLREKTLHDGDTAHARSRNAERGTGTGDTRHTGAAVQLADVTKRYGVRKVLDALDLQIEAGSFVAIVGRSGCGKSTLLRLLAGLETPDAGEVSIGHARDAGAARMMFQDARLLPWKTVLENVMLGLSAERRDDALAVLAEVGLAERARDWPAQLSGGERQRVALARALVHRPRLLLLDEPLGALDALTRIEMHALIERLWREHGFTAVLVTHDAQEAVALAERVVLIDNGRITHDVRVALARPRERGDAAFGALEARVLDAVMGTRPISQNPGARTDGRIASALPG